MPAHDYTPDQALELLTRKLRARDDQLAAHIQSAIDVGKDVSELQTATDGRKKPRVYRKTVPFSQEEALRVALDALQAYFVEQPLFVDAAADNFARAAIGVPANDLPNWAFSAAEVSERPEPVSIEGTGSEKAVEVELQTETQISRSGHETVRLKRVPKEKIEQQRQHILQLRALIDFKRE